VIEGVVHGRLSSYTKHGCRCQPCSRTAHRYSKWWKNRTRNGEEKLLVDAEPVRQHVEALLASGMTFRAVSLACGYVSRNALVTALGRDKVRKRTAEKILAVTLGSDQRDTKYVDPTGAMRRLQALAVLGHTSRELGEVMGMDRGSISDVMVGRKPLIRQATHDAAVAAYEKLWDKPGSSGKTRTWAAKQGWLPPLAWDDDTIDRPDLGPAEVEDEPAAATGTSRVILIENFLDTRCHHEGDVRLAAMRLGVSHHGLSRALFWARSEGLEIEFFNTAS
jgi:hypothetical protein